jgi:hypothetical protein
MHRVVGVLVEKTERGIINIPATKISEILEAQDLVDVFGGRVMIMDALVDALPALVFSRVTQRVSQRIRHQQCIDNCLTVGVIGIGCYFGVADRIDSTF